MAHHIRPASVSAYLSGICNTLEPFFPDVRAHRNSAIVSKSLAGMKKLRGASVPHQKRALTSDDLSMLASFFSSHDYDNHLFLAMLLTGFSALLRLGEMTLPDTVSIRSSKKFPLRHTLTLLPSQYSFFLPFHKADRLYEGSKVIVLSKPISHLDPVSFMSAYISCRDAAFPYHPELWLTSDGVIPTSSWFISRLHQALGPEVGGHSLRSGGATALALSGVPDNVIQGMGRWSSDSFKIYIRKHPVILHALLHGHPPVDSHSKSI
jgi:hypothetical protein